METKKHYTAPQLTVVTVKAEKGYAASGNFFFNELLFWEAEQTDPHVETYNNHDVWNDGSGFWE